VSPQVFVNTLLAVIRDAGMAQRVWVQSFNWRTLMRDPATGTRPAHGRA
jgi:hypothetical protein